MDVQGGTTQDWDAGLSLGGSGKFGFGSGQVLGPSRVVTSDLGVQDAISRIRWVPQLQSKRPRSPKKEGKLQVTRAGLRGAVVCFVYWTRWLKLIHHRLALSMDTWVISDGSDRMKRVQTLESRGDETNLFVRCVAVVEQRSCLLVLASFCLGQVIWLWARTRARAAGTVRECCSAVRYGTVRRRENQETIQARYGWLTRLEGVD